MNPILESFDPGNGELLGSVPVTTATDMPDVVARAKQAARSWRMLSLSERARQIETAFEGIEPHQRELARLLSREMGKDGRRAMGEVGGTVFGAAYHVKHAKEALKTQHLGQGSQLQYQPLGIAAVISPWNYPLAMAGNLIVPALMAGNPVIFKPSEETPLVAEALVELLNQRLPEHLLQIVHGDKTTGQALVESDVQLIAFTGSRAAGKDIMARAAGGVKRLVMELGGNDPLIVMHNANLEAAARFAVASSLENAGQMCTSTERIYVDARIAERFEARVVEIASQYSVGPWDQHGVNVGPIVNARQHAKIVEHIDDALALGARRLLGDEQHQAPYIRPTVLADITPEMVMERQETFGPVIAISRFERIEDAIERANDSDYGLGAVVFGNHDVEAVAAQLEAGMVAINQGVGGNGDAPWVGAKQSGFGFHGSAAGHRQFAQPRLLSR